MRARVRGLLLVALYAVGGCASRGSEDTTGAPNESSWIAGMVDVPTSLGGIECSAQFLNNNSEVVLLCPTAQPFRHDYALWSRGVLQPIAPPSRVAEPVPDGFRTYQVHGFADDGTIVGTIEEITDEQGSADTAGGARPSFTASSREHFAFVRQGGVETYFPIESGTSVSISDNGRYLFINAQPTPGDNGEDRGRYFDMLERVTLAELPKNVFFEFGRPVNSGELVGASVVGDFARYPSIRSRDRFEFLAVIGRPEFSIVSTVLPSNTLAAAITYETGETAGTFRKEQAAFIAPNRTIVPIVLPTATDTVQLIAINDSSIVIGDAFNVDGEVAFNWIFSPLSAAQKLVDLFPELGPEQERDVFAVAINDRNQMLVYLPREGDAARLLLVRLHPEA